MKNKIVEIKVSNILTTNENRIQRDIDTDGVLGELKNNIEQYGMKVPLLVTDNKNDTYSLVDGYRRLQVVVSLDMNTVPCVIVDTKDATAVGFSLNIHREDLTSVEIGTILLNLYQENKVKDSKFKYSKLVPIINKSKAYISQHIGYVNKLSIEIQTDIIDNKRMIDKNILTRICQLTDDDQKEVYDTMVREKLGREAVQKLIDNLGVDTENPDIKKTPTPTPVNSKTTERTLTLFTNEHLRFTINSNSISKNDLTNFESEILVLLKKYNLSEEV